MNDRTIQRKLSQLKQENNLSEIAIFNESGTIQLTDTEKENKIDSSTFPIVSEVLDIISKGYDNGGEWTSTGLEDSDFYLHFAVKEDETNTTQDKIIALEYRPTSATLFTYIKEENPSQST